MTGDTPAPLRILHVMPTYYPAVRYGGPIRSVHGLAVASARRGQDVHVYTTSVDGDDDLDVPLDRPTDLDGVKVHYFRVPALRRLYWSPTMAAQLRKTIGSFDVVHLHSVFLWPIMAAARSAARAGVPYLLCPRGMLMREVVRRKSRWVKTAWINLIEKRSIARAAGLHLTAELEVDEIKAMGLPARELFCLPNGVSIPARHPPLSAGPFAHVPRPYALFLGRISWKKGLDRLIPAWQHVPDLPLVIAGNDEEGYRSQLEALAHSVGVHERVHFIGAVGDDDKWALYENAEMFLLPSYSENFGNTVAEAMAMGCPVIISPEVGIASLVRESGAGLVVSSEPRELAEAVRSVRADHAWGRFMGEKGARAVTERLSWDAVAARMESVYRQISTPAPGRQQLLASAG